MPATTHDVLLEIGVEELPARFCAPALAQLKARAAVALVFSWSRAGAQKRAGNSSTPISSSTSWVFAAMTHVLSALGS